MNRNNEQMLFDSRLIYELTTVTMPYGRYKDRCLCDLPESYVIWFHRKGFPHGKLGTLLSLLYEIQLNGLQYLLKPLVKHPKKQE
jgi:uncharacterized protein (DUF3820 family)